MALIKVKEKTYPVSGVACFQKNYSTGKVLILMFELVGSQYIKIEAEVTKPQELKHIKQSMDYLVKHMEKDIPIIEIDVILNKASELGMEMTVDLKRGATKNTEGVFIKMPREDEKAMLCYTFVSADAFKVEPVVHKTMAGVKSEYYLLGNKKSFPTLCLDYLDLDNAYRLANQVESTTPKLAKRFEDLLYQNAEQGYIDLQAVADKLVSEGIQNLKRHYVMSKLP